MTAPPSIVGADAAWGDYAALLRDDFASFAARCFRELNPPMRRAMKSVPGPPMTLGSAAAAQVRLIVWCKDCRHQVEPDPAEMAARYGAEMPVLDWRERLVCSRCGSRQVDMVVSGTRR